MTASYRFLVDQRMKLPFLLFIALLVSVFVANVTAKWSGTEIADSLDKWKDVGLEAGHTGVDPGISTAIGLIGALGKAIPYAGPLAGLVSGILSFFVRSDTDIIKEKLEQMNQQLRHIDEHLNEVLNTIVRTVTDTAIKSEYQVHVDKMMAIKVVYDRYMGNPTNQTLKDFRDTCREVKMLVFADWIERGLTGDTVLPLRSLIVEDYDPANLNTWSYRISQALSKAAFLHITCVGVAEESEQTINETLNGNSAGGKGDMDLFHDIFHAVTRSFNVARKEIKKKHFLRARAEAKAYLDSHTSVSHDDFRQGLFSQLKRNYPERAWFVAAWDAGAQGFRQHTYSVNSNNAWIWRESSRNLLVGSIPPHGNSHLADEIAGCIEDARSRKVDQGELAKNVFDDLKVCVKTPLAGLAVVKFGNSLREVSVDGYGFFSNAWYGQGASAQVSILAIMGDPTFVTEEEVCFMSDDVHYGSAPAGHHCCLRNPALQCADDKVCRGCD